MVTSCPLMANVIGNMGWVELLSLEIAMIKNITSLIMYWENETGCNVLNKQMKTFCYNLDMEKQR